MYHVLMNCEEFQSSIGDCLRKHDPTMQVTFGYNNPNRLKVWFHPKGPNPFYVQACITINFGAENIPYPDCNTDMTRPFSDLELYVHKTSEYISDWNVLPAMHDFLQCVDDVKGHIIGGLVYFGTTEARLALSAKWDRD